MNLLEIKTPTPEEQDKMKLYHHACFELLKNGTISLMEEYECKPGENVNTRKATLMTKHMVTVDDTIRIEPKRKFDSEINEAKIEDRKKRRREADKKFYQIHGKKNGRRYPQKYNKGYAKEYYQEHKEAILTRLKEKQVCPICNIIHNKGNAHNHLTSARHKTHEQTGQPYTPKTSLERATQSWLKKREIPFTCDCGAKIRSCSKLNHFKTRKHLAFMTNQIVAQI